MFHKQIPFHFQLSRDKVAILKFQSAILEGSLLYRLLTFIHKPSIRHIFYNFEFHELSWKKQLPCHRLSSFSTLQQSSSYDSCSKLKRIHLGIWNTCFMLKLESAEYFHWMALNIKTHTKDFFSISPSETIKNKYSIKMWECKADCWYRKRVLFNDNHIFFCVHSVERFF